VIQESKKHKRDTETTKQSQHWFWFGC